MCGICGWFNTKKKINFKTIEKMNNIAAYRGPDDEGYLGILPDRIAAFRGKDSCVSEIPFVESIPEGRYFGALGHRRLSIIDLSPAGHQPMVSDDENYCITFNGEIYNYIEIQHELISQGYTFSSNSDTEVLLKAYMAWGEQCVQHFNGMWAFALWDKRKNTLFCSRDRLGAKPFYYYLDDENFIFSSEIKQICQNDIVPRIANDRYLAVQIAWKLTDYSEETFVRDIKALKGGYNLTVSFEIEEENIVIKNTEIKQYWDINTYEKNYNSVYNDIFSIHQNAVDIRTRSDVPIGILLSGGLDSSTLTAEVSELFRKKGIDSKEVNTFTSCWENYEKGDEWKFADLTNKFCGVTGHQIYPKTDNAYYDYKEAIWHSEGLFPIEALGSFLMLKNISKFNVKVMLNGQGSDETMFGYERYYAWYLLDVLREKGIIQFVLSFKEAVNNSILSRKQLIEYIIYFNNFYLRRKYVIHRIKPIASKSLINLVRNLNEVKQLVSFRTLPDLQYNEIRRTQLTHILRNDDRNYMAFSMESRVPFIDYRYIERACTIPEENKIQHGYTKYPLRKYIEGKLPTEVVWRKNKMGWPSPRNRWIDGFDSEYIYNLFTDSKSARFFDIDKVKRVYEKDRYNEGVEMFINTELLLRLFDVQT